MLYIMGQLWGYSGDAVGLNNLKLKLLQRSRERLGTIRLKMRGPARRMGEYLYNHTPTFRRGWAKWVNLVGPFCVWFGDKLGYFIACIFMGQVLGDLYKASAYMGMVQCVTGFVYVYIHFKSKCMREMEETLSSAMRGVEAQAELLHDLADQMGETVGTIVPPEEGVTTIRLISPVVTMSGREETLDRA